MSKINVYSVKGTKLSSTTLPKSFSAEENLNLLAQAIHVYRDRLHTGVSKTKTRSEVKRTKRKWYRQKGTGGARHGARSAPIFVGGGVAHGPKKESRELVLPAKMRKRALNIALNLKTKDSNLVFVDGLSKLSKTAEAKNLVKKLEKELKDADKFTFVLSDTKTQTAKALRNLKETKAVTSLDSLNAYVVYFGGILVFDKGLFAPKKGTKPKNKTDKK